MENYDGDGTKPHFFHSMEEVDPKAFKAVWDQLFPVLPTKSKPVITKTPKPKKRL